MEQIKVSNFSENLTFWLECRGRKATWLAKQVGVSPSRITAWKKGKSLPGNALTLEKLAKSIGVPVPIMFCYEGIKCPEKALKELKKQIDKILL